MLYSAKLAEITGGYFLQQVHEWPIEYLLTDSRHSIPSTSALFFAIVGKNHDGHEFLEELYQKGVRQFVIQQAEAAHVLEHSEANVLVVKDTVSALQQIAAFHRQQFHLDVIGVTGSNGKTIVKEWLYQLLSPSWSVVKSPKSYNSQIGVPLSVWQIKAEHKIGIFEAGISHVDEMTALARVIQPRIGIFTNLGPAHSEGFGSMYQKADEKAQLFASCETIIYPQKYKEIDQVLKSLYPDKRLLAWTAGEAGEGNVRIDVIKESGRSKVDIHLPSAQIVHFVLPFTDDASIENLVHCLICALGLGLAADVIQSRIDHLSTVHMRLQLKAGRNESYVIDDTYNNDPEGLRIALNFMQQQAVKKHKVVILSDMLETGIEPNGLYKGLAKLLREKQIDQLFGVGHELSQHAEFFPANSVFFQDTGALLSHLASLHLEDSLILVKGARVFRFERVVQMLEHKIHRTVLEINLNALAHNLNVFRQMLQPDTKMMVMVKAFAYGAGSHEVAHLLQYNKVDYLAVAYTDEGVELRENNVAVPIMVMNPTPDEFEKLVKNELESEIYSFKLLESLLAYLSQNPMPNGRKYCIHLAIDTGMHRLGFEEHEIDRLIGILKEASSSIKVASIFSHLVGADEPEHDFFSDRQAQLFLRIAGKVESAIGYKVIKHLLNSAGITRLSRYQFDMVRLGIGLYGIEAQGHPVFDHLQTVGTLKTLVSQMHTVKAGETVGYSRKGKTVKDSTIATIAIGYADGFSRAFSNGVGKAWIKGQLVPVIGNVCMDMTMLDVTGMEVKEGDEVILFGKELPVQELAKWIKTIPYEILTNVSERVKRVFFVD